MTQILHHDEGTIHSIDYIKVDWALDPLERNLCCPDCPLGIKQHLLHEATSKNQKNLNYRLQNPNPAIYPDGIRRSLTKGLPKRY